MKQSKYEKVHKQPPHKLENEFKLQQSQLSILSGSGHDTPDLYAVVGILDGMLENWKKNNIKDDYDSLYQHVWSINYLPSDKEYENDFKKAREIMNNFCYDMGLLAIRTPTLNANSKDKEKELRYAFHMFLLIYYISLFNQICLVEYKDLYKYCGCNHSIIPTYDTPATINEGNCKHTSVFGYLYLKDPKILQNVVYNEFHYIRMVLNNYNKGYRKGVNWINNRIEYCKKEIENLYPSVLFQLTLVILNKGFYNLYNSNDIITYNQLKKEIIFCRLKNEI